LAKIILEIEDKNLDTVLHIINNLKEGLISNVEVDKKRVYNKPKPIQQEPLKPVSGSKYIDAKTFKERLKKQREKNG
jgi:hypothetical protein